MRSISCFQMMVGRGEREASRHHSPYPVAALDRIRANTLARNWSALYQQRPTTTKRAEPCGQRPPVSCPQDLSDYDRFRRKPVLESGHRLSGAPPGPDLVGGTIKGTSVRRVLVSSKWI